MKLGLFSLRSKMPCAAGNRGLISNNFLSHGVQGGISALELEFFEPDKLCDNCRAVANSSMYSLLRLLRMLFKKIRREST